MSNSYRDLIAWQKAMALVTEVYRATNSFPENETRGISDQMRRAAVSVVANIAEGQGRNTHREFRQFLGYSKGSLTELETELLICRNLSYLDEHEADELLIRCDGVSRLVNGLMNSLKPTSEDSLEKRETRN